MGLKEDGYVKYNAPHWVTKREERKQQLQVGKDKLSPTAKRILIVDDDLDITFTFKKALEEANRISGNKISFQVNAYNDPALALSEFKPDSYDLLLVDINMPEINGFEFALKIMKLMLTLGFAICPQG